MFFIRSAPLLLLAAAQAVLTGATECESYSYMYTLQPPEEIVCSPYNLGILNLTCAVSGSMVENIQWYFRPAESNQQVILSNNSQVTITRYEFDGDYSMIIIIDGLSVDNEGFYWCQGLVRHNDHTLELSQSSMFELKPRNAYFPFDCPTKALKSSEVRCAAIIPPPIVSNSPSHSSTFNILVPLGDPTTVKLDPSSTHMPTQTVTTHQTSPTSYPTVTDNTIGVVTTDPQSSGSQTDFTTITSQPPLAQGTVQLSDIILYAILGLLGCLVVLVFSLSVVISILCCKKRHRGIEGKEAPYDQFSTESEGPPGTMTLKSLDSYPLAPPPPPPYRLPLHPSHSSTMTSSSSGVYDEIHTIAPHHNGGAHFPVYQEIPAVQVDGTTDNNGENNGPLNTPNPSHIPEVSREGNGNSADNCTEQAQCEHPYDLPNQPGQSSHSHPQQGASPISSSTPMPPPSSTHHHHNQQQQDQQRDGYDSLERVVVLPTTEQADGQSSIGDSSEFTNSNLQVTPPPEESSVVVSSLTGSSCPITLELETTSPEVAVDVDTLEEEENAESSGLTLPAIPEHPYHVLEDTRGLNRGTQQNGGVVGDLSGGAETHPPQILCHLSLSEDEGYDRLVGPPHIYHILQKSPSLVRPRFREASPVSGYHHLNSRMESEAHSSNSSEPQHGSVRLQAPSTDSDSPQSEENSMVSGSEIFDDPQYNFSPKRFSGGSSSGQKKPPQQRNSHSGQVTTLERKKVAAVDLSKYRGDYERDPMYMQLVQKLSDPAADSDQINIRLLVNRDKGGSNKSASLPDITHTYQSLQALTRDPLRNYEMLHRRQNPTNV